MESKTMILRLLFWGFLAAQGLHAQQASTSTGHIWFYSETPLEEIRADNHQVRAALNLETGQAAAVVQIRSFKFPKALMEEHFNDNYLESHKFPRATFSGTVEPANKLKTPGSHTLSLTGDLEIHGVIKPLNLQIPINIQKEGASIVFSFTVTLQDYGIKNDKPRFISNQITVTVNFQLTVT